MPGTTEVIDETPAGTAVSVDRALTVRTIRNLLVNAHCHAVARVRVVLVADGHRVWLHVDDDRPGVAPENR